MYPGPRCYEGAGPGPWCLDLIQVSQGLGITRPIFLEGVSSSPHGVIIKTSLQLQDSISFDVHTNSKANSRLWFQERLRLSELTRFTPGLQKGEWRCQMLSAGDFTRPQSLCDPGPGTPPFCIIPGPVMPWDPIILSSPFGSLLLAGFRFFSAGPCVVAYTLHPFTSCAPLHLAS